MSPYPFPFIEGFPTVRTVQGRGVSLPLVKPGRLDNNRLAARGIAIIENDTPLKSLPMVEYIPKFAGRNVVRIIATLTGDFTDVSHTV